MENEKRLDLIDRNALISEFEWMKSVVNESSKDEIQEIIQRIENVPTVDAVEVVHGEWVGTQYDGYADGCPVYDLWECSNCREEYESEGDPPPYNYCPNCGADMR